ncbi:MAG: hypothetical protein ABR953_11595 [Candidatus Acidiferrales bacterium]
MLATVMGRIASPQPISEELREMKESLLGQTTIDLAAADAFLAACREERTLTLEQLREAARAACRKQSSIVATKERELRNAELNLQNAVAAQEFAQGELGGLHLMETRGQHVPRWASQKELAAWALRLEKAKEKLRAGFAASAEALQERNAAAAACEPELAEMSRLAAEELRLRHAISGQPYIDAEYGLSSVPAGSQ